MEKLIKKLAYLCTEEGGNIFNEQEAVLLIKGLARVELQKGNMLDILALQGDPNLCAQSSNVKVEIDAKLPFVHKLKHLVSGGYISLKELEAISIAVGAMNSPKKRLIENLITELAQVDKGSQAEVLDI